MLSQLGISFRRYVIVASCLLGIFSASAASSQCTGNTCSPTGEDCTEPTEANAYGPGTTSAWVPGSVVNVNINTTNLSTGQPMSSDQVQAIVAAFNNWNGVMGVTFQITTSTTNISETSGNYNVNFGPISQGNAYSEPSENLDNGTIEANQTTVNYQAGNCTLCITDSMSHDIGHSFGLNDNDTPVGGSPAGSAMDDYCGSVSSRPPGCGSPGPTPTDMQAADCESDYDENVCVTPGNTNNPACACGPNTSGDCSGGLTCTSGTCG